MQPTHSINDRTLYILLKWVQCRRRIGILLYFCGIFKECWKKRMGKKRSKRFMKLPLKVNMGFKLRLRCCEDLRLISFRCWLAGVWLREGTHIYAVSHYQRVGWPCLEEQSCLCAYLPTGLVWPSATANWQQQPVLIQMEKKDITNKHKGGGMCSRVQRGD